ncbi:MAG: GGDEF domain-containing protein [Candidatus Delongbacteria bacterium]|nr:GGDEF domain-containing protein [Candidatus Delongbacteria bacterium]MBN2835631.1 GGDEF domain-containing protein [Candidatus Delongbacteria bacterium]
MLIKDSKYIDTTIRVLTNLKERSEPKAFSNRELTDIFTEANVSVLIKEYMKERFKKIDSIIKLTQSISGVSACALYIFNTVTYSYGKIVYTSKDLPLELKLNNPSLKAMLNQGTDYETDEEIYIPLFHKSSILAILLIHKKSGFRSKNIIVKDSVKLISAELLEILKDSENLYQMAANFLLQKFVDGLSKCIELHEAEKFICEILTKVFKPNRIIISKLDYEKNQTIVDKIYGTPDKSVKEKMVINGFSNMQIVLLDSKKSTYLENNDSDSIYGNRFLTEEIEKPYRNILLIPLLSNEKVNGSIQMEFQSHLNFRKNKTLFDYLGRLTGQFFEKLYLYRDMEEMATTDYLTGVLLKREFIKILTTEIERSQRVGNNLSLLMIDVDKFKLINDNYGHLAGDYVLKTVASVIKKSIRKVDIAGRYAGDEFCVVLYNTGLKQAKITAERIRKNIEAVPVFYNNREIKTTLSIGIAELSKKDVGYQDLIMRADIAMYKGRKGGSRNVINAYDTKNVPE